MLCWRCCHHSNASTYITAAMSCHTAMHKAHLQCREGNSVLQITFCPPSSVHKATIHNWRLTLLNHTYNHPDASVKTSCRGSAHTRPSVFCSWDAKQVILCYWRGERVEETEVFCFSLSPAAVPFHGGFFQWHHSLKNTRPVDRTAVTNSPRSHSPMRQTNTFKNNIFTNTRPSIMKKDDNLLLKAFKEQETQASAP